MFFNLSNLLHKTTLVSVATGLALAGAAYGLECPTSEFGPDDEIGRANFLTEKKVRQAAALIKDGHVYELGRVHSSESWTAFPATRSFEVRINLTTGLPDGILTNESHVEGELGEWASQWDGLPHFGFEDTDDIFQSCFYNNYKQEDVFPIAGAGAEKMGAENVPPFVTRGILLDIAKLSNSGQPLPADIGGGLPYVISAQEIVDALKQQAGIQLTPNQDLKGDVVLIRTGWDTVLDTLPNGLIPMPGISIEAGQLLADEGVVMVGSDNFGLDAFPLASGRIFPVHQLYLTQAGVYIMENLQLQELSDAGVHKFFFSLVVNKWKGAVDSPAFPIAIGSRPKNKNE